MDLILVILLILILLGGIPAYQYDGPYGRYPVGVVGLLLTVVVVVLLLRLLGVWV